MAGSVRMGEGMVGGGEDEDHEAWNAAPHARFAALSSFIHTSQLKMVSPTVACKSLHSLIPVTTPQAFV